MEASKNGGEDLRKGEDTRRRDIYACTVDERVVTQEDVDIHEPPGTSTGDTTSPPRQIGYGPLVHVRTLHVRKSRPRRDDTYVVTYVPPVDTSSIRSG